MGNRQGGIDVFALISLEEELALMNKLSRGGGKAAHHAPQNVRRIQPILNNMEEYLIENQDEPIAEVPLWG